MLILWMCYTLSERGKTYSAPKGEITLSRTKIGKGLNQQSYDLGADDDILKTNPDRAINETIKKLVMEKTET